MNTTDEYCIACGQDGPLRRERKSAEFDVRGETLHIEYPVKACPSCGTTEVEQSVDPSEIAFAEYRKRKQLLTPERIKEIRERYLLSQKSFAALLGMSEATINRYDGGGIQAEAHDQAIRGSETPDAMRDLLGRRGDRLSDWKRKRVEAALAGETKTKLEIALETAFSGMSIKSKERTPQTGYREFDFFRYAAVVVWLCRHFPLVTATSLNKLLFYVDFLHYKYEAVSLTGSKYRRVQHGPVPAVYGDLQDRMELAEFIEAEEVQYQNGRTGMEFHAGPDADELDVEFSARELKILEAVAQTFRKLTPTEIRDLSHKERAYWDTEDKALITYDKAMDLLQPAIEDR